MAERAFPEYLLKVSESGEVQSGTPLPLGAHQEGDGVNFAMFSRHATGVDLHFFDHSLDEAPSRVISLDPSRHRTGDVWHVWVKNVQPGQLYAYRIEGPYEPRQGDRFNPNKLVLDPFSTAVTHCDDWSFDPARGYDPHSAQRDLSFSDLDDAGFMPKSVFTHDHFDWEGDRSPKRTWSDTVIYETHVRGCTIDPSSGVEYPGTYRGLVEKLPYFKALGVTSVELMPVFEFNQDELTRVNPLTGERLKNYWGYNPVVFMAPESLYCSSGSCGQQKLEFKEMIKAFHREDLEVILDVVLNHTAEGNELGPTLCFRGIDNSIFYMLDTDAPRFYQDYTGTGNSLNANHPAVRDFILDVLRYWVTEMHVDGFRFDLASVLGRDTDGSLLADAPLLERIAEDPILRDVKLIAEAWDDGGAYQVGSFSQRRWAEWNGRFRDDVRRFWRGDEGMLGRFASRICGSADLYQHAGKGPESSINFVTCHDGFTLNDLVSYKRKHNEANGHDNRDGTDENYSENYGAEGSTDDPVIQAVRERQMKNILLTLFISRGVPMLLGGDEFRRTQQGNNNPYCQDNEVSWYDWTFLGRHADIHRFTQSMIAFRRAHPILSRDDFYADGDIEWLDPEGGTPNWWDPKSKCLSCRILGASEADLCLMFNASNQTVTSALPALEDGWRWRLAADTGRPSPMDILPMGQEAALGDQATYQLGPRSSVILVAAAVT